MSFHHNFGVSETTDEFDSVLRKTVADLKNPPRVPHQNPPNTFSASVENKNRTKGFPISSTERFISE